MDSYKPSEIEPKWQKIWQDQRLFSPDLKKFNKPFYNLMMFPYPSAEGLHVGNMYAFTGSDIYGRYMRMRGYDVFEPIGLDGFGIHSENYAIKVGKNPKVQAKISQNNFYRQLKATGNAYDWSRTLETYDPDYYKWTQWIFVQLFKKGLAYRAKSKVNFCPSCKTVLADEQVIDGKCERCSTVVEKKELEQWFFRITDWADRLLEGLSRIDWSERVKIAQRNWIGKRQGVLVKFKIFRGPVNSFPPAPSMNSGQAVLRVYPERNRRAVGNPSRTATPQDDFIEVFTTRPDTLYGATFLVIAPKHPAVTVLLNKKLETGNWKLEEISNYIKRSQRRSELERKERKDKTGVFTGFFAINPVNGEKIPIWIADYVLEGYGTGAIMAVPAHDVRDFEFAKKYKLEIRKVISPNNSENEMDGAYIGEGKIINSKDWNGLEVPESIAKIIDWLEKKGIGKREVQFHLRDWLISRQRYWGPPIPVIYCVNCWKVKSQKSKVKSLEGVDFAVIDGKKFAIIAVPEEDLPVLLPDLSDWQPKGTGKSPLATVEGFVKTKCPNCGGEARRETDVSDTFLDSAWYFLRYPSINAGPVTTFLPVSARSDLKSDVNGHDRVDLRVAESPSSRATRKTSFPWDSSITKHWLPVDMYIGGAEHSVLHLLYSRFLTMALGDMGYLEFEEPFSTFRAHGLLISKGAKMSKSRGNVVNPDDYIEKYGSDTLRCYLMFCGRFQQGGDFQDQGIEGIRRFLNRVWRFVGGSVGQWDSGKVGKDNSTIPQFHNPNDLYIMHKTIQKVSEDIENLDYNTAISALMIWLNALEKRAGAGPAGLNPAPTSSPALQSFMSQGSLSSFVQEEQTAGARAGTPRPSPANKITKEEVETFLKLLAPFAPHMTEELWSRLSGSQAIRLSDFKPEGPKTRQPDHLLSIHLQPWPEFNAKLAMTDEIELVIQVNGKVRDRVTVMRGISHEEAENLALKSDKAKKYLGDKGYRLIFVADKLINFVVKASGAQ